MTKFEKFNRAEFSALLSMYQLFYIKSIKNHIDCAIEKLCMGILNIYLKTIVFGLAAT